MFSFKENTVYTNSVILIIKFRKDVPGIVFSIQVLSETEKNSVLSSIKKKWHQEISRGREVLEKK